MMSRWQPCDSGGQDHVDLGAWFLSKKILEFLKIFTSNSATVNLEFSFSA